MAKREREWLRARFESGREITFDKNTAWKDTEDHYINVVDENGVRHKLNTDKVEILSCPDRGEE